MWDIERSRSGRVQNPAAAIEAHFTADCMDRGRSHRLAADSWGCLQGFAVHNTGCNNAGPAARCSGIADERTSIREREVSCWSSSGGWVIKALAKVGSETTYCVASISGEDFL